MYKASRPTTPLAAVLFAALIALQSVGWFLAWKGLLFEAKIKAHNVLVQNKNSLPETTFHKEFFRSVKIDRKEIIVNGHLFDYRILSETRDSICLTLYHDKEEQALLSVLGQIFKSGDDARSPSSPVTLWIAKWLGSDFLIPEKAGIPPGIAASDFYVHSFSTLPFAAQEVPRVFAPPPEL